MQPAEGPGARAPSRRELWRWGIWVVIVVFGLWLRLRGVDGLPLYGDEFHTLVLSTKSYGEILTLFDKVGSHVPLPLLQRISLDVFGESLISYRLPAILPGLLTLVLFFPLVRGLVGRDVALAGTAWVAVHPMLVYYTRFARAYALMVFLGLLLLALVARGVRRGSFQGWTGVAIAVVGGLLPFVHLSSLGFVLFVGLAGIALVWRGGTGDQGMPPVRTIPGLLRAAWPFLAAAALATALFLPLAEHVAKYVARVPEEEQARPLGLFEVADVLAGARWLGFLLVLAAPLGLVALARERRQSAWLVGAAVLGPLAFLLALRPHGMAFAWSRYLIVGLPALLLLLAAAPGLLPRSRGLVTVATGLVLAGALHATGPLAPGRSQGVPYTNTYLAMKSLRAFDRPWQGASPFWKSVRRDVGIRTIIETMPLFSRSVHLYRNQAMQHGKEVLIGWCGQPFESLLNGPYIDLRDIEAIRDSGADLIVLHHDLTLELEDYWRFVYEEAWPEVESEADAGFMERNKTYFLPDSVVRTHPPPGRARPLQASLEALLGPPAHRDKYLSVWMIQAPPRNARRPK